MGAWGNESCSSDSCWDMLGNYTDTIHEMTQDEVDQMSDHLVDQYYHNNPKDTTNTIESALGCIIWALGHGLKVTKQALETGQRLGQKLLADRDYIKDCGESRENAIRDEIQAIQKALASNGQGEKKHFKSVREVMDDHTADATAHAGWLIAAIIERIQEDSQETANTRGMGDAFEAIMGDLTKLVLDIKGVPQTAVELKGFLKGRIDVPECPHCGVSGIGGNKCHSCDGDLP